MLSLYVYKFRPKQKTKQKQKHTHRKPCNETEVIRQFFRIFLTFKIL